MYMHFLAVLSIIFCFQVVLGSFSSWYTWLCLCLPVKKSVSLNVALDLVLYVSLDVALYVAPTNVSFHQANLEGRRENF